MGRTPAEKGRAPGLASGHAEKEMGSLYIFKVGLGRQIGYEAREKSVNQG